MEDVFFNEIEGKYDKKDLDQFSDDLNALTISSDCSDDFKKVTKALENLKTSIQDLESNHADKLHNDFQNTLNIFSNLQFFASSISPFVSKTICIENDETLVSIFGTKKNQAQELVDVIKISPTKGWKLDIAGGIFFGGLTDNVYTKKY